MYCIKLPHWSFFLLLTLSSKHSNVKSIQTTLNTTPKCFSIPFLFECTPTNNPCQCRTQQQPRTANTGNGPICNVKTEPFYTTTILFPPSTLHPHHLPHPRRCDGSCRGRVPCCLSATSPACSSRSRTASAFCST